MDDDEFVNEYGVILSWQTKGRRAGEGGNFYKRAFII